MFHDQKNLHITENLFSDYRFSDQINIIFNFTYRFVQNAQNFNQKFAVVLCVLLCNLALTSNFVKLLY